MCPCGHGLIMGTGHAPTEGHVTVVHGNGIHACSAAINGAILARADPQRTRVVVSWNVSEETRRILSRSWAVVEVPAPPGGYRGLKAPVLGVTANLPRGASPTKRKGVHAPTPAPTRRLRRAVFWDADHLVLPSSELPAAFERLWSFGPDAKIVSVPERAGCFNSGFFMFRPSTKRQREYEWLLRQTTPPVSCDKDVKNAADQSYLNAVFWNRDEGLTRLRANSTRQQRRVDAERYVALDASAWIVRTPLGTNANSHPGCLASPDQLLDTAHSFHFFDRFAPWGLNCSVERAYMDGSACGRTEVTRSEHRDSACSGHAAAQAMWYGELLRLPVELRRLCHQRLSSVMSKRD